MVAFQATVHDGSVSLFSDTLFCDFGIDPVWITPHLWTNFAKFDGTRCVVTNCVLERLVEVSVVQEDVWIMVPSVEMTLDGLD